MAAGQSSEDGPGVKQLKASRLLRRIPLKDQVIIVTDKGHAKHDELGWYRVPLAPIVGVRGFFIQELNGRKFYYVKEQGLLHYNANLLS